MHDKTIVKVYNLSQAADLFFKLIRFLRFFASLDWEHLFKTEEFTQISNLFCNFCQLESRGDSSRRFHLLQNVDR